MISEELKNLVAVIQHFLSEAEKNDEIEQLLWVLSSDQWWSSPRFDLEAVERMRQNDSNQKAFTCAVSNIQAMVLAEVLRNNTHLETLDLTGSTINFRGGCSIVGMLQENASITRLILDQAFFYDFDEGYDTTWSGPTCIPFIFDALRLNNTLKELSLRGADVGTPMCDECDPML